MKSSYNEIKFNNQMDKNEKINKHNIKEKLKANE